MQIITWQIKKKAMEPLTELQIQRVVSNTLQNLGLVSKIIKRSEVLSTYGRVVWDKATKDKNIRVFKTGNAKSAMTYLDRAEFLKWVDEKILFKDDIKNLKR